MTPAASAGRAADTLAGVLVLALDTSTPAVTTGLVGPGGEVLAESVEMDARRHAELLAPAVRRVCAQADRDLVDVTQVLVGVGPGPFTGLRVGLMTATALAHALGVPATGLCSLDALVGPTGPWLAVTDARRREVYWARYCNGVRVEGPSVERPVELGDRLRARGFDGILTGPGADLYSGAFAGLRSVPGASMSAAALALRLLAGASPLPVVPLYLRRPDASEPRPPKSVTRLL